MLKYFQPADVQIEPSKAGTNTYIFEDFLGRNIVTFGRSGIYPSVKNIQWSWEPQTAEMTLLGTGEVFNPDEYWHAEFAPMEVASVDECICSEIAQYPQTMKWDIASWQTDLTEPIHYERRCRVEYGSKGQIDFNGGVAKAVVYLPLPKIKIAENIPVTIFDASGSIYESGTVVQFRTGFFNQRVWLGN